MNKMQSWFGGQPVDVLTDPETQSDGSPGDNQNPPPMPSTSNNRPPKPTERTRLPSDDTLNRSSHGTKSNVDDLRNSNSALIHQLSTQEASFMNQLTQCTTEFAEKEKALKKELTEVSSALQVQQNRVASLEQRIRERDTQFTNCKDEKGKMGCQITDLKNQLYQLQFELEETSADKADSIQNYESKLTDATRSVDEMKRALDQATSKQVESETKADELKRENEILTKKVEGENDVADNQDYAALLKKVQDLEVMNAKLQKEAKDPSTNEAFQRELSGAKQVSAKEMSSLRSMLRARDDAIQSLQQRLEKSKEEMTDLEAEVDTLRSQSKLTEEKSKGELGNLWKLNDEMAKIIEKQSHKVEDLNEKLDKKDEAMTEALQKKDELIGGMQEIIVKLESKDAEGALKEENAKLRRQLATFEQEAESTHHERISALEYDRDKMTEKVDDLNKSLSETLEEVDSLQTDLDSKKKRIVTLEKEAEDANRRLNEAHVTAKDNSDVITRLRTDIENVTMERARLQSNHADEIATMKSNLDKVNQQFKSETSKVKTLTLEMGDLHNAKMKLLSELDESNNRLQSVDDAIEVELEECRRQLQESRGENSKLQEKNNDLQEHLQETLVENAKLQEKNNDLRQQLQENEDQNAKLQGENEDLQQQLSNNESEEVLKAQKELLDTVEKKTKALRDSQDQIKKLNLTLADYEEQVVAGEAKLNGAIQERELIIGDLKKEVCAKEEYATKLKTDLEALQSTVEKNNNSPLKTKRSFGMAIDPECDDDSDLELSKLKRHVSILEQEKSMVEREYRSKLEDRDNSISSLVTTSSKQESSITALKKEVSCLQLQLETEASSESGFSSLKATSEDQRREMESLKGKLQTMSAELSRANKKVAAMSQELEHANEQLCTAKTTQDIADLAGRLAVSDQTQRMIKKENEEKLKERDAAISNLLQTIQANEKTIKNLTAELDNCKKNVKESLEENQRLQHESEIFAAQIIDQDAEFADLNAKLKEKNDEIKSMKEGVTTSKLDARKIASLQRRLDDMKDEKERQLERVDELSRQLRKAESANAGADEFEVERLKDDLKIAKLEKQAIEERLTKQIESLRKLRNHAVEDFEAKLRSRDDQIASLETELLDLKEKALSSNALGVELNGNPAPTQQQLDELTDKCVDLGDERDRLKCNIAALNNEIATLKASTNVAEDFEAKLRAKDDQIILLQKELLNLKEKALNSNAFDVDLDGNPAPTQQQLDELTDKCVDLGDERDALKEKIAWLNSEIATLKASSETSIITELRSKLAQSEAMRDSFEKNRSMFTSDRDAEIDRLHKQLSEAREEQSTREMEQTTRLKELEQDNHELRDDFTVRMKEKNARIVALEQTLAAQEQVVGNMSSEMDQLQNGMEKISIQRRAEIEEMQQELMDYTTKATKLEREVSSLSMTLNETKHKHKAEVEKLKSKILALESESPFARDIQHTEKDDEKIQLTEKIEHMKWLNSTLKDENDKLQEQLEKATLPTKKNEASASAKNNDKWRNVQLMEQVAVLSQRVIELEETTSTQVSRTPGSPRRSILESPIVRSSLGNVSAPATPKSALRVSSYEINQANDELLSSSARDETASSLDQAPPQQRESPTRGIPNLPKSKSSKISIGSMMKRSGSVKRTSPRADDSTNSTTNYNF